MNLEQAQEAVKDGYNVELNGKKLTNDDRQWYLGDAVVDFSSIDPDDNGWDIVTGNEQIPKAAPKKRAPRKKAV